MIQDSKRKTQNSKLKTSLLWQRVKASRLVSIKTWQLIVYPFLGLLALVMFGLSLYELYVQEAGPDVSTYIGVPAHNGALPPADYYGAFLLLKPGAVPRFPSNLVQLLET